MSRGLMFFCFKQKTSYEVRISDWSADVCSSDLYRRGPQGYRASRHARCRCRDHPSYRGTSQGRCVERDRSRIPDLQTNRTSIPANARFPRPGRHRGVAQCDDGPVGRSEAHTSELQSLMRISYAVFCLKKKSISDAYTFRTKSHI